MTKKYAFCNEMFGDQPFDKSWNVAREIGFTGVEIAPYTLVPGAKVVDVRDISKTRRMEVVKLAAAIGLEIVGLHWLLTKTVGLYLTSPDASVRKATVEYLKALVELCADINGQVMVLGSPLHRNLLPGVSYAEAELYAAEVLRAVMPTCKNLNVTIALEPLGPSEGDFLLTAESGIHLAGLVDSRFCQLHLDVKAMSSEVNPIARIIRESRDWLVHFHANDPNLLGPGMGSIAYEPIAKALEDIKYDRWISIEVFKYEPNPESIARRSMEYLLRVFETEF